MENPLEWLLDASRAGCSAVISDCGPILSRSPDATGAVALFGSLAIRTVLSNVDTFGMPQSLSVRHRLPPPLANLNRSLFSMSGIEHRAHQKLFASVLAPTYSDDFEAAIDRGLRAFLDGIVDPGSVHLVAAMRRLAQHVAEEVLLGSCEQGAPLGAAIQEYFEQRRAYSSRAGGGRAEGLAELVSQGTRVDALLRSRLESSAGVVGRLRTRAGGSAIAMTEQDLASHANVLFMSSCEPVATAMTWIVLALTQRPDLRQAIAGQLADAGRPVPPLLAATVRETLRLVPPNALMARLTRAPVQVGDLRLAAGCEVIVSPFVEHRDPTVWADPTAFRPPRWEQARPDPYHYLPFGAGGRPCLGRHLAMATLERATAAVLRRFDPVLASPQFLDWRINLTLLPAPDPTVRLVPREAPAAPNAELSGPCAALLSFA